jgi:molecular chaperone HtpG
MSTKILIPFQIETQRVIELLAKQIYQSPLALLRENAQNAFDAVRQRLRERPGFAPRIDVVLTTDQIIVADNGIGMTKDDLANHYWKAGSSSKNNEAARAAGVVGTFGIGAMANFGIAHMLVVETESAITGERTLCRAEKAKLSMKEDCIEMQSLASTGQPGTTVTASVEPASRIDVATARDYIAEFVSLVDIPFYVNNVLVSGKAIESAVPLVSEAWREQLPGRKLGARLIADCTFVLSNNADIWLDLSNLSWAGRSIQGRIVLRSGLSALRTFRSGFGLATASVSSAYQFGGVADLLSLEPTAGREAITVDGLQMLQSMMVEIDAYVSAVLAGRNECDLSTPFMNWIVSHNRYDLCGRLKMSIHPGERVLLSEVAIMSQAKPILLYEGADPGVIKLHSSDDTPLLQLARSNPRRRCEQGFLAIRAKVQTISDKPVVHNRRTGSSLSVAESALGYRIEAILDSDYFLRCEVDCGEISHGLPVMAINDNGRVRVTLNPHSPSVGLIMGVYDSEYTAFGSMAKDFVRNVVFPRVADFVPSSTRQGAEAFLKAIRRPREYFEYADNDLDSLPKIWEDYDAGLISVEQAVNRSRSAVRGSVQVVEVAERASNVVPDVISNERALQNAAALSVDPAPAITRLEIRSAAKLLVIDESEPALRGYRCFLALTDKVREEMGEFFLQPHRTSIVWGGQKTVFIFQHHSERFGLYYDLQTRDVLEAPAGGGAFATATIVLKDRIFVPIPEAIKASFIPKSGHRKRFDVRADILRTEGPDTSS